MKIIIKNLYMALTAVCLVALVVFIVQLIIINSGTEPENSASVILGGSALLEGERPNEQENPFADYEPPPPTPRPDPQGVRYEMLIYENLALAIYAQTELFEYIENEFDWFFRYRGGGSAGLEIGFTYLSSQVGADAEAFLNSRIEEGRAEYRGAQEIVDSHINGFSVTARSAGISYEAWLYRIPDTELALYFLINFEFTDQRDELYTVLSTISIIGASQAQGSADDQGHTNGQSITDDQGSTNDQDDDYNNGEG